MACDSHRPSTLHHSSRLSQRWGAAAVFNQAALSQYIPNTPIELHPPAAQLDGRPLVTRRRVTKRDRKRVAELYLSGRSIGYVASEVGIGRATVLDILKRFGIERRPVGLH